MVGVIEIHSTLSGAKQNCNVDGKLIYCKEAGNECFLIRRSDGTIDTFSSIANQNAVFVANGFSTLSDFVATVASLRDAP